MRMGYIGLLALASCAPTVEHQVTAPQLDPIVAQIKALKPPAPCRPLDLPPVPDQVHLTIEGDFIGADAGGEQLLRGYVRCRSLYRAAAGTAR